MICPAMQVIRVCKSVRTLHIKDTDINHDNLDIYIYIYMIREKACIWKTTNLYIQSAMRR